MTLRRYAPLALVALALGCEPKIDERANATTVDYALFNPAASQIPTPNDAALSKASAFLPGGACAAAPCNTVGPCNSAASPTVMGLCAYNRAGGFPAPSPVKIGFLRGTLGADGAVAYAPAPPAEALMPSTLLFAGASLTPTLGVVDLTTGAPVTNATPTFDPATGALTLVASGGAWTAGHRYAVQVQGGAKGPTTLTGGEYTAMPAFFILREAVIANLDLSKPENQGLFPGDAAAKMTSGTALEALRASYHFLYATGGWGAATTALKIPFAEAISLQTFQIAPGGTVTIGNGTDPANFAVTGAATAMIDAFTLQSSVKSATVPAITFNLATGSSAAVANLFISAASDCTGTALGTSAANPPDGNVTIALINWLDVPTTAKTLYVCVTTKAPTTPPVTVSGGVTAVVTFAGTGFTSTGTDTSAVLTVN